MASRVMRRKPTKSLLLYILRFSRIDLRTIVVTNNRPSAQACAARAEPLSHNRNFGIYGGSGTIDGFPDCKQDYNDNHQRLFH